MTVVDAISAATGLDHDKAESAAGAILGAIRMSATPEHFAPIDKAIPDVRGLILRAGPSMSGGRTGEILALVSELKSDAGVAKLSAQLGRAGISPEQVAHTAKALIDFVKQQEGEASVTPLLEALPGFRDLAK
ncbi:MAG TPA: DUF2780 domain-containing protein [Gemmatimonadales bacterium]|nr:DUF2780 domain-containing protein [Gemmatimonadales bacterium]